MVSVSGASSMISNPIVPCPSKSPYSANGCRKHRSLGGARAKRANIVGDLGSEAFKNVSMFKRTTGGDIIEAEIKGANKTIKFAWTGKHWFDANDLPDPKGDADTDAFYNRLLLAAFSKQIPKDQINRNLGEQLNTPEERSGILNWMLDGLSRLEQNGQFTDNTDISTIREYYKRASNTVYCFAEDLCKVELGSVIHKGEAFRLYAQYCVEQNFSQIGKSKFYEELQANLPSISSDKETLGDLGRVHVFLNLAIEGADPSRVSRKSTHSSYPHTANTNPTQLNMDNISSNGGFEGDAGGVGAGEGYGETVDKMDKVVHVRSEKGHFECNLCGCRFGTEKDLTHHLQTHVSTGLS